MGSLLSYFSRFSDSKEEKDYPPNLFLSRDTKSCTQKSMLLIGNAGSGKSSFVNSMYTAVFGYYEERAYCGSGSGKHSSRLFRKYDLSEVMDELSTEMFNKHQLPVLFDMSGLPPNDTPTDRFKAVLRVILMGRLPLKTNVKVLISNENAEIPKCVDVDPIDRVIFVAAADEDVPTAYFESVMEVCEEVMGEEFTVFGILTKWDKLKSEKDKTKKYDKFRKIMHADGTPYKVLAMSNYCGDFCKTSAKWCNRTDIDEPLLKFLAEICRPEYDPERDQSESQPNLI